MKIAGPIVSMLVMTSVYAQQSSPDEKQILKLEDDWARALKTKDREVLDAIVAPNFTFIEPDGDPRRDNGQQHRAELEHGIAHTRHANAGSNDRGIHAS